MKKLFFILAVMLMSVTVMAQDLFEKPLPVNPEIRMGVLENGMQYYILKNNKPQNLADFYIVHNVGAIQEDENQRGLAHFLEHMAFNGTKNFPDKQIIKYLESIGVMFGANLNAGTGVEATTYMIKDVPLLRESIVDSALLILSDWAHDISLLPEEIEKERGVILEEMRLYNTKNKRISDKEYPTLFNNSKFAFRHPIGTEDVIKNFSHDQLRRFYHDWYRTDLQAIVVVGDFDPDKMENKVKELFSKVPAIENPQPKEVVKSDTRKEDIAKVITDPEETENMVKIFFFAEKTPTTLRNTQGAILNKELISLISDMFSDRLSDIEEKPGAPFTSAFAGYANINNEEAFGYIMALAKDSLENATKAVTKELNRIRKYGFNESELERAKAKRITNLENRIENIESVKNGEYVSMITMHIRSNDDIMSISQSVTISKSLIETITLDQVNSAINNIFPGDAKAAIFVNMPESGKNIPTDQSIIKAYKVGLTETVEPLIEDVKVTSIMDEIPTKGKIKKESIDVNGNTVWTLSNGAKVILRTTDFDKDNLIIKYSKEGGSSLLEDDDVVNSTLLNRFVNTSGIGEFSDSDLRKILSGKKLSVSVSVNGQYFTISGNSRTKDAETMMQLINMKFNSPRFDSEDFDVFINKTKASIENSSLSPDAALGDSISASVLIPSKRVVTNTVLRDNYQNSTIDDLKRIYHTFTDSGVDGGIFYVIGSMTKEELKPLIETYIASLPKGKTTKQFVREDPARKGKYDNVFARKMEAPKTSVYNIVIDGNVDYNAKNIIAGEAFKMIMRNVYFEIIREEKGATYGVGVNINLDKTYGRRDMLVGFDTNDEMADEMDTIVYEELKNMAQNGTEEQELNKAKEIMLKNFTKNKRENGALLDWNQSFYENDINMYQEYEKIVNELTTDDMKSIAEGFVKSGGRIRIMMRPE